MDSNPRLLRRAATLLEVLFATLVIVVGLIGIASMIPFAARDAQQAINHNQAVALGASWTNSFLTREFHRPSGTEFRWIWLRDYTTSNGATTYNPQLELFSLSGYTGAFSARINGDPSLVTESPSFSGATAQVRRNWGHMPVCLDPSFFSSPTNQALITANMRPGWYRAAVFPYFLDNYDPAVDPFSGSSVGTMAVDQPRMLRIGLAATASTAIASLPEPLVSCLFGSTDDLIDNNFVDEDDTTDVRNSRSDADQMPAERLFAKNGTTPLRSLFGKRYTWMATITPEEPTAGDLTAAKADLYANAASTNATVTLLVMTNHDSTFTAGGAPGSVDDKPKGERVVRVYPLSGNFVGGAGGRVRLIGNAATSSRIEVGDWIMLSRYYVQDASTPPGGMPGFERPRFYPFFRWYRIIGVDSDAAEGTLSALRPQIGIDQYSSANNMNDSTQVWSRDISVEGLDFRFGEFPVSTAIGNSAIPYAWWPTIPTPTTGTLVSGVVTVFHTQITLN